MVSGLWIDGYNCIKRGNDIYLWEENINMCSVLTQKASDSHPGNTFLGAIPEGVNH